MKQLAVAVALMLVAFGACAQESAESSGSRSFGVVIYAEGNNVSIIRDQRRAEYDAYTGELLGQPVYPGDIIQTDPETSVEIQFLPSRSVIKVAENTSFAVDTIGANGDGVFDLSYGRLRARVSRIAGNDPFQIRAIGAVAGVRGTDFGTDVVAQPGGGTSLTRIYCFEGEVEVSPRETGATAPQTVAPEATVTIGANQMITASIPAPSVSRSQGEPEAEAVAIIRPEAVETISEAVVEFWHRKEFVAEPEAAAAVLARYPSLRTDAVTRLGEVAFLGAEAGPSAGESEQPVQEVPDQGEQTQQQVTPPAPAAVDAIAVEGDKQTMEPERRLRLISATKTAGIAMTAIGALADGAAVTLLFFGDQLLPAWPAASDPDTLTIVAASGGVFLIGGILSLMFSLQLGR